MNYVEIESAPKEIENKIKQNLKFKTGKFVWRIKFSAPLDPSTVNNANLFVTDLNGNKLNTSIHYNNDTQEIEVEPLEAYAKEASYYLNISKNVMSLGGQSLKQPVKLQFKV